MAPPTGVLWDRDPHTAAKHQMLLEYLAAWFPIIASGHGTLTYIDAFAGPGEYTDGSLGSPLIALSQALRGIVIRNNALQNLIFIEENGKRLEHLVALIENRYPASTRPHLVRVLPEKGDCRQILSGVLAKHALTEGPVFANLDGWGVDTPMSMVRQLGRMRSAEVLITFKPDWFWRFVNTPDPVAGDRVFGDAGWREIARSGGGEERKKNLVTHYRSQLTAAGFPYQLTFELVDEGGRGLFLVYATTHQLGVEKMKDAMWKVDTVQGQHFRDPRDVNQLALDLVEGPDLTVLRRQLLDVLASQGPTSLASLKTYTLLETLYRPPHAVEAIRQLEEDGLVHRSRAQGHENQIVELSLLGMMLGAQS